MAVSPAGCDALTSPFSSESSCVPRHYAEPHRRTYAFPMTVEPHRQHRSRSLALPACFPFPAVRSTYDASGQDVSGMRCLILVCSLASSSIFLSWVHDAGIWFFDVVRSVLPPASHHSTPSVLSHARVLLHLSISSTFRGWCDECIVAEVNYSTLVPSPLIRPKSSFLRAMDRNRQIGAIAQLERLGNVVCRVQNVWK